MGSCWCYSFVVYIELIVSLFDVKFTSENRDKEEETLLYFQTFLDDCESMICLPVYEKHNLLQDDKVKCTLEDVRYFSLQAARFHLWAFL